MKDGERRMIVIADDITGAAEIAGIAHRFGLATRMVVASGDTWQLADDNADDIVVIATDTRSMTKSEAVAETVAVARQIRMADDQPVVFKKTDSALRGHVAAELVRHGASQIILGHLSKENNFPELAMRTCELTLQMAGIEPHVDASIYIARRDGATGMFSITCEMV